MRPVAKNAKKEPVTVVVREPIPGDWEILAESHPHAKKAAQTAVWSIAVPARGETELTYSARVRY